MAYVTLDQLRAYVRDEGRGLGVDVMQSALSAAEAWVGDYCQRSFAVAGASSARVFVPTGTDLLPIHDATAVTVVAEDGTTLATTAWQLEPLNGLDGSGRSVPYSAIRRIDGDVWEPSSTYPGKAIISVTGTWGWSAVPDAVVQATPGASRMSVVRAILDDWCARKVHEAQLIQRVAESQRKRTGS